MSNKHTPSFTEAMKNFFDSRLAETLHTCMPGKITKYDSTQRKAEVLPLIKKHYNDGTIIEFKPITNVPVMFYGAGSAGMRLPAKQIKGQTCLLVFCERSIDFWLKKDIVSEPGSKRKFDLTDAIALLSVNSFHKDRKDSGGDNLEIYFKESVIRIKENGSIEIGIDTFRKLVNEAFMDLFNNHTHNYMGFVGTGTLTPGVTSSPAKVAGTIPVRVNTIPSTPPSLNKYNDDLDNTHLTSKVKVE